MRCVTAPAGNVTSQRLGVTTVISPHWPFAAELRAARAKAGLSRNELAAQLNYSGSLVGMIEKMARVPSLEFAQRADAR